MSVYTLHVGEMSTGIGPTVWAGELRRDRRPFWQPLEVGKPGVHNAMKVAVGVTKAEVVETLQRNAAELGIQVEPPDVLSEAAVR